VIKAVYMERGDLFALARLIEDVTASPDWQWWRGPDPEQVQAEVDRERRLFLLVGDKPKVEEAAGYVRQIAEADAADGQVIESITAQVRRGGPGPRGASLAVLPGQGPVEQQRTDRVAVIGSREGNLLIVSAPPEEMPVLRDLVAQIDQPEMGEDRRIEVYTLANSDVREAAARCGRCSRGAGPIEDRVIVTPQPSRGALIVSAPDSTSSGDRVAARRARRRWRGRGVEHRDGAARVGPGGGRRQSLRDALPTGLTSRSPPTSGATRCC
jgi:hypothetical protein